MDIQTIILGFLMARPMTGYDIKQAFGLSFGFFSGMSYGSIYPALRKMESQGLVDVQLEIQENAPNKKLCTITDKGREQFLRALREPLPMDRYKNSFMSRLFFFSHLDPQERGALAGEYVESLERTQRHLAEIEVFIKEHADPFQRLCFECGQRFVKDLKDNISRVLEAVSGPDNA